MPCMLLFTLLLLLPRAAFDDALPQVHTAGIPATDSAVPDYADDRSYPDFAGRLYADAAGIDVALYASNSQHVVDRRDSAAYFDLSSARGRMIIADHNTHAFSALSSIRAGDTARIQRPDGSSVHYECAAIIQGRNTGKGLTDSMGSSVAGKADLIMYTCSDGWQNIWIVLWNEAPAPQPSASQTLQHLITQTDHLITRLLLCAAHPVPALGQPDLLELTLHPNPR